MDQKPVAPACSFCNGPMNRILTGVLSGDEKAYDVYWCRRCSVGMTNPFPSMKDLSALYSGGRYRDVSGARFNAPLEHLVYLFRLGRKNRIKKYVERGRILDVGCGRGLFLAVMKRDGWKVTGTEFDEETAAYASDAHDVDVIAGDPEGWKLPDESFDVITINHALEHLQDPVQMLDACGKLLRPGGLLVIAVPNSASLQASAGKGSWFHLDLPYHLYHFSEEGLADVLKRRSFSIAKIRRFDFEQGPFGWLQTLLNLSGIRKNLLYDLLKKSALRKSDLARLHKAGILFTVLLLPLYFPLSFALSLVESFFLKRGGTVEVYATKNNRRSVQ